MTPIDAFTILGSVSLIVIATTLALVLSQIRRTFRKAELLLDTLNRDVGPLCKSMTDAATELEALSIVLYDKVDRSDRIFETVQQSADTLLLASNMVRETVLPVVTNVGGFAAGVRAFSHFFTNPSRKP